MGFSVAKTKTWREVYDGMVRLTYSGRILKASESYLLTMRSVLIRVTRIASNASLSKVTANDG